MFIIFLRPSFPFLGSDIIFVAPVYVLIRLEVVD
jgi:hypothetical protein